MSKAIVIDLCASSGSEAPTKTPSITKPAPADKASTAKSTNRKPSKPPPDFDSDSSLDFVLSRPSKRARLSPPLPSIPTISTASRALATASTSIRLAPAKARPSRYDIDSDPIIFTSSPRPTTKPTKLAPPRTKRQTTPIGGYSDDDLLELSPGNPTPGPPTKSTASSRIPKQNATSRVPREPSQAAASKRGAGMTSAERESQALDKERSKEEKTRAKEAEKERKALTKAATENQKKAERAQKAADKKIAADLVEANKARWDKKVSVAEMVVDLPLSIAGKSVDTKAREMLKVLGVETTTYPSLLLPNVVKWRRKAKNAWNEELGHWELLQETRVQDERHVLCLLEGAELVALAMEEGEEGLEAHVRRVQGKFKECKIIYLIEGLETLLRKSRNKRNREYQARVRAHAAEEGGEKDGRGKRKTKDTEAEVDEERVEDALMILQMVHECLVYHTVTSFETAEWVVHFTQHISTIPYKKQRSNIESSFCMDVGQVRTGEDKHDTYVKMLQQIVRVTAPIAYGIAAEYQDVTGLTGGFEKGGPLILEDLKKCSNKNGAFSDARIGPAISKRLEKVFLGRNPFSTDI